MSKTQFNVTSIYFLTQYYLLTNDAKNIINLKSNLMNIFCLPTYSICLWIEYQFEMLTNI